MKQKPIRGSRLDITHRLSRGMVGCWLFNEGTGGKVFDLSLNRNHGNFGAGVAAPTWVAGRNGSALDFDGINDYVNCGNNAILNLSNTLTLVAWISPDMKPSGTTELRIIQKGGGGQATSSYGLDIDDVVAANEARAHFYVDENGDNDAGAVSGTTDLAIDGTKYCLIGTWDGSYIRIYINGTEENSKSYSSDLNTNTGNLFIGARPDEGASDHFNGRIDEVQIYNRVLSAQEIAWLYQEPYAMFLHI